MNREKIDDTVQSDKYCTAPVTEKIIKSPGNVTRANHQHQPGLYSRHQRHSA